jgi:squalene-hopene/tetraprenyl-beta-curcumene cyclase
MRKSFAVLIFAIAPVLTTLPTVALAEAPAAAGQVAASADKRVDAMIDRGLAFLKAAQLPSGGFVPDQAPPAMNALVLKAFVQQPGITADTDFVARGFEHLLKFQLKDGGIYKDLLATYNTAIAISALSAVPDGRYKAQVDEAVAYLRQMQWTTDTRPEYAGKEGEKVAEANQGQQVVKDASDPFFGGWGYGGRSRGAGRPDLSNAQMAIEALHDAGVSPSDPAFQNAIKFLERIQNAPTNDQKWAGTDGGFIYGPSADRSGESFAGEFTDSEGNRRLRSYGSMTYAGLKSFIYAGLNRDDPRVQAAYKWIAANWTLDENPGMRAGNPDNAQHGLYYYYHTLARALHEYDSPTLTQPDGTVIDWRVQFIERLEKLQKQDGSFVGEKKWMEDNPILVTSYIVLALQEVREDLRQHPVK